MAVFTGTSLRLEPHISFFFPPFQNCELRGKLLRPSHQQRYIAVKSKVNITSNLSPKSVNYVPYRDNRATRRRNKFRDKLMKDLPKPQSATDPDESSKKKLGNVEPNEEVKSEADKAGVRFETFSGLNVQESYNINGSQSLSEELLEFGSKESEFITDKGLNREGSGFRDHMGKMWDDWRSWYEQTQKDFRAWGVGSAPIFVVHDTGDGKVKVSISEKEINNRFGDLPFPGDYPDEARTLLGEKLAQAKKVARDIEAGVFKPPRNSRVYKFVGSDKNDMEKGGLVGSTVLAGVGSVIRPVVPILKVSVLGLVVLSGSLLVWATLEYVFYSGPLYEEESGENGQRVQGEIVEDDGIFDLNLETKRKAEVRNGELVMDPTMDAVGFEKRMLNMQGLAGQTVAFFAMILQNMRAHYKEAQVRKKQLAMKRRLEFEKRIGKIRDMARQVLSIVAMALQNKRVPTMKHVAMKPSSMDGVEFEKRIVEIQDMARQARVMEQNAFPKEKNHSNSEMVGRNADEQRTEEGRSSNFNVLRKNVQNPRNPDVPSSNVVSSNGKSKGEKKTNMRTPSNVLSWQSGPKNFTQGNAGNIGEGSAGNIGDNEGTSNGSEQSKVDKLQDVKSSAERPAEKATKDPVNVPATERGEGVKKRFDGKRSSVKYPVRIDPEVIKCVKEAMEALASKSYADNATKETVNVPETEKGLGEKKGFGGKRFAVKGSHKIGPQEIRHQKDAREILDSQSTAVKVKDIATKETVNLSLGEKGGGKKKRVGGKRYAAKGSHRDKPRVTTNVKEAKEILAYKNGKHGSEFKDTSNLSNKSAFHVEQACGTRNSSITKEELSSSGKIMRKNYKNLKPAVRKVENDLQEKISWGEELENASANPLETAEVKEKMDVRNTMDIRLQIKPENDFRQGNDILSQEAEELEWMRDEVLRKIVLKVWDNENAGREPYHGLVSEDEMLFFRGLERKFEREGESVKIWIKDRVDNLKYGKDSPGDGHLSKFSSIFLKDSAKEDRHTTSSKINQDHKMLALENMMVVKENLSFSAKSIPVSASSSTTSMDLSITAIDINKKSNDVMDSSIGEAVSAEGKVRNYEMIIEPNVHEQKGTVSKDDDNKQEMKNLLWWLDLPYVLCIGISRNNAFKGLYSLDMAPVSESAGESCHIIAFEDHGDAMNMSYMLQSHFNELGDTRAHVIPLLTKEYYEEAKSAVLNVTVIKRGELQLYAGQPLQEVESRIIKIGTAVYSKMEIEDQDVDSYVKDVFGNKSSNAEQHKRQLDNRKLLCSPS